MNLPEFLKDLSPRGRVLIILLGLSLFSLSLSLLVHFTDYPFIEQLDGMLTFTAIILLGLAGALGVLIGVFEGGPKQ